MALPFANPDQAFILPAEMFIKSQKVDAIAQRGYPPFK